MKPSPIKAVKAWAPDTIYLTRDGWNDDIPSEDCDILWCENRITKTDVEYRRVDIKPRRRK